jgi:divalent metal cation (Fe/Co/Zn/Cd) transporter
MSGISRVARPDLVRRAFRLEWFTSGWMLIEAAVAIASGAAANSLSLIAFGADSLIELASAGVLLWRLDVEMRRGAEFPETVEQRASRIGGALLFVLAAYVVASAAYGLWVREGQEFSTPGLVIAALAIPVMCGGWRERKYGLPIRSAAGRYVPMPLNRSLAATYPASS